MIRTTAVPRPVRVGAALAGVAGLIALAGCAAPDSATDADAAGTDEAAQSPLATGSAPEADSSSGSVYTDGTYTADGSYATPESVETVTVTVTLEDDVITAVEVVGNPTKAESKEYQSKFIGGIADVVVGEPIDEISVSRVAGSSLTSGGFNKAIEEITAEAAA